MGISNSTSKQLLGHCDCGGRAHNIDEEVTKTPNVKKGAERRDTWQLMDELQQRSIFEKIRARLIDLELSTVELRHEICYPLSVMIACGTGYNLTDRLVITGTIPSKDVANFEKLRDMVSSQLVDPLFLASTLHPGNTAPSFEALSPRDGRLFPVFGGQNAGKIVCAFFWTEGIVNDFLVRQLEDMCMRCDEEWQDQVVVMGVALDNAGYRKILAKPQGKVQLLALGGGTIAFGGGGRSPKEIGIMEPCIVIADGNGNIVRNSKLRVAQDSSKLEDDIRLLRQGQALPCQPADYDQRWQMVVPEKRKAALLELGESLAPFNLQQGALELTEHRVRGYCEARHGDFLERYVAGLSAHAEQHDEICELIRASIPGVHLVDVHGAMQTNPLVPPSSPSRLSADGHMIKMSPTPTSPSAKVDSGHIASLDDDMAIMAQADEEMRSFQRLIEQQALEDADAEEKAIAEALAHVVPPREVYARPPSHAQQTSDSALGTTDCREGPQREDFAVAVDCSASNLIQQARRGASTSPPATKIKTSAGSSSPPTQSAASKRPKVPPLSLSTSPQSGSPPDKRAGDGACEGGRQRSESQPGGSKVPPLKLNMAPPELEGIPVMQGVGESMADQDAAREARMRRQLDGLEGVSRDALLGSKRNLSIMQQRTGTNQSPGSPDSADGT